jgi:RNA polymerase sigma factor (sigma-70 family)
MSDSVRDYLNNIAKTPLLTPQQEIQLGKRVARWRELRNKPEPLTDKEQQELKGGLRARDRFIKSNLQLVVYIAKKYESRTKKSMEMLDIIQEGNIGLAKAVELFDHTRGYKFSTYAYWWIRQSIGRAIQQSDSAIRLPCAMNDLLNKAAKVANNLAHQLGRTPTAAEVASHAGIDIASLLAAYNFNYSISSLDQPPPGMEDINIAGTIPDPKSIEQDADLDLLSLQELSDAYLDENTKYVLHCRALDKPISWRDLEKKLNMTTLKLQRMHRAGIYRLRMLMTDPLEGTPLGNVQSNHSQNQNPNG